MPAAAETITLGNPKGRICMTEVMIEAARVTADAYDAPDLSLPSPIRDAICEAPLITVSILAVMSLELLSSSRLLSAGPATFSAEISAPYQSVAVSHREVHQQRLRAERPEPLA